MAPASRLPPTLRSPSCTLKATSTEPRRRPAVLELLIGHVHSPLGGRDVGPGPAVLVGPGCWTPGRIRFISAGFSAVASRGPAGPTWSTTTLSSWPGGSGSFTIPPATQAPCRQRNVHWGRNLVPPGHGFAGHRRRATADGRSRPAPPRGRSPAAQSKCNDLGTGFREHLAIPGREQSHASSRHQAPDNRKWRQPGRPIRQEPFGQLGGPRPAARSPRRPPGPGPDSPHPGVGATPGPPAPSPTRAQLHSWPRPQSVECRPTARR